jgi:hypothetical protein
MGKKSGKNGDEWQEARRRCRLSDEEVRMAKELGFKPRSLIKNIPAKSQPWKAPVSEWVRDLYAKRFGEARRPEPAKNPSQPSGPPPKPGSSRVPGLISQPKGRITIQIMADVIRRIEGMDLAAKVKLCDDLAANQPDALSWVLLLHRQGVSMPVVDHVLHIMLVISESIKKTLCGPVPRVTLDTLEKADAKVHAMFRLLQGESKDEAAWLTYLMAEAHPERNLYAYVVTHLSEKSGARDRPGDERAIYATAVLLEAFLQAAGLAQARK